MNLRCIYCQTPFTLARSEMLGAIISMNERHQNHYDAHCPRCRRANSISRQRMELFFPNWQAAAKQLASAPPVNAGQQESVPATAFSKTEPVSKDAKGMVEKKTAAKSSKPAEKAAQKPAGAKAPAAKKSAATPSPKAKKTTAKSAEAKPKKK